MFSKTSPKNILNKYDLDLISFVIVLSLSWISSLKKTAMKLELLTHIDMLPVDENGTRGGITRAIKDHAEAN